MDCSRKYSCILADSGNGWAGNSRPIPSFIAFKAPECVLTSIGQEVTIKSGKESKTFTAEPLDVLEDYLAKGFIGAGYVGYEYSKYTMEGFSPSRIKKGDQLPDVSFMFFKPEDMVTGDLGRLSSQMEPPDIKENIDSDRVNPEPGHICSNMSKNQYIEMVQAAKKYIEQGDIYQVNLSQKMTTGFDSDALQYFLKLQKIQPVPYGSYLDFGDFQLLSGSMELFLRKSGGRLVSNPIKGTIKRGESEEKDTILKAKLIASEKERAENLMIVDLMRNDLGRVCMPGTVKVNKLFEIETYNTLHQMVSEVEGVVHKNINTLQMVKAVFPPGSVTGAPKKRTLEVIDELEPHLRGPYCGAIGIFYPDGDFTLSVAIRIMTVNSSKANFWVGGGIVWDSDPEKEYNETLLKSSALAQTLGVCGIVM